MPGYNFQHRSDIEKTIALVRNAPTREVKPIHRTEPEENAPLVLVFQTPSGGIPGRSGSTCGAANCTPYYIDENKALVELSDNSGTSQTFEVLHIGATAIAGNTYIQVKKIGMHLVADMEDCE